MASNSRPATLDGMPGGGSVVQEHEVLSHLLSCLPSKAQRGLFTQDVAYTCIDVSPEFIAIGTNVSIVFLYDRLGLKLQRLYVPMGVDEVTKVKLAQSVDYVVAVGTSKGVVLIFQLPSYLPGRNKQLQMFQVAEVHQSAISSLCWSANTERLFSGDSQGNVICTEIDYTKNMSRSYLVCQEPHQVIQLDYAHRALLVSTKFRTVLILMDEEFRKVRVGQKDRKILGNFGGCFAPGLCRAEDAELYAARPGLRFWRATMQGKVTATYIFKDLLNEKTPLIPLLPDTRSESRPSRIEEKNFGLLHIFDDNKIVTWQDSSLFVINPAEGTILGWHGNLGRVQEVAVSHDEIFVLRSGPGSIIFRLATKRDYLNETAYSTAKKEPVPLPMMSTPGLISDVSSTSAAAAANITILQQTATKVSQGLLDSLKEKISQVQEGQRPSSLPPWGFAPGVKQQDSIESVDSAKEAKSTSSSTPMSPDVLQDVMPQDDSLYSKVYVPTSQQNLSGTAQTSVSTASWSTVASSEVTLSPSQNTGQAQPARPQPSPSSASPLSNADLPASNNIPIDKLQPAKPTVKKYDEDIVFSRKPKKHKKKKKNLNDMDTDSIHSGDVDTSHSLTSEAGEHDTSISSHSSDQSEQHSKHSSSFHSLDNSITACHAVEQNSRHPHDSDDYNRFIESLLSSQKYEENLDKTHSTSDITGCNDKVQNTSVSTGPSYDITVAASQHDLPTVISSSVLETPSLSTSPSALHSEISITSEKPPSSQASSDISSSSSHIAHRPDKLENLGSILESPLNDGKTVTPEVRGSPIKSESTKRLSSYSPTMSPKPDKTSNSKSPSLNKTEKAKSLTEFEDVLSYKTCMNEGQSLKVKGSKTEIAAKEVKSEKEMFLSRGRTVQMEEQYDDDVVDLPSTQKTPDVSSPWKSDSSMEDFYSHYQSSIYSPQTPTSERHQSLEDALENSMDNTNQDSENSLQQSTEEDLKQSYTDTWTEFICPGHIQSLALSQRQVWIVDKNERLHFSTLSGPGLRWRKLEEPFHQVAVSPSGAIVWRLHRTIAYAATGISTRNPAGVKWTVSAKEVSYIAVDETVAWYIRQNGSVYLQKSLCRDRPTYRALKVDCKYKLRQVCCRAGVLWAVTQANKLLVRTGIADGKEEGLDWTQLEGEGNSLEVSHLALGDKETAWILDNEGCVWFTTDVSQASPMGSKLWWQISMSEYLMQDATKASMKSLTQLPRMVVPTEPSPSLIAVGSNGVWVCPASRNVLHICRGSLTGHRWEAGAPSGIAASARWQNVCATAATKKEGLMWVYQPNNAIFSFPPHTRKVMEIRLTGLKSPTSQMESFTTLCATREAVWLLLACGQIVVRTGMGPHCPQGISWEPLDLTQLGGVKLVSISCGMQNVWAVDSTGQVYLRIGLKPPSKNYLSPAWVPVDGSTHHSGAKFIKVVTSPNDWMVWAVDNRRCVYVRDGITDALPIGTHWIYISGTPGEELCVSESYVYTLNPAGEILIRFGITSDNIAGDYWKKIPGFLKRISTTRDDEVWGINTEGQLQHRVTRMLERQQVLRGLLAARSTSISDDWELL